MPPTIYPTNTVIFVCCDSVWNRYILTVVTLYCHREDMANNVRRALQMKDRGPIKLGLTAFKCFKTAMQLVNYACLNKKLQSLGWRLVSVWWSTMTYCWHTCNMHINGTRMCGRLAVWRQEDWSIQGRYRGRRHMPTRFPVLLHILTSTVLSFPCVKVYISTYHTPFHRASTIFSTIAVSCYSLPWKTWEPPTKYLQFLSN